MKKLILTSALILAGCGQPKSTVQAPIPTPTSKRPISEFPIVTSISPTGAGAVTVTLPNGDYMLFGPDQAVEVAIHWRADDEIFEKQQDAKSAEKDGVDKYWNKGDGWWVNISLARRNSKIKE